MVDKRSNLIPVGRINGAFGIKGWVKIHSDTQPQENIFQYSPWWLKTRHGVKQFECDEFRTHGNGWIAHLKGVDDRDVADSLARVEVAIDRSQLPELEIGEYYWSQLIGLRVIAELTTGEQDLGAVTRLLETGANDVLVVKGDDHSLDNTERLIPYIPEQFIKVIDIDAGVIRVDWDPEF